MLHVCKSAAECACYKMFLFQQIFKQLFSFLKIHDLKIVQFFIIISAFLFNGRGIIDLNSLARIFLFHFLFLHLIFHYFVFLLVINFVIEWLNILSVIVIWLNFANIFRLPVFYLFLPLVLCLYFKCR